MPRDEPSLIVAPGECDELGAQFLDGFERPHQNARYRAALDITFALNILGDH